MEYAFVLGRTNKISIAELGSFFGDKIEIAKNGAVAYADKLPAPPQDFLNKLGGCVEILEIFEKGIEIGAVESSILEHLIKVCEGLKGKLLFALNIVPEGKSSSLLKYLLPKLKKSLRAAGASSNYMNKDMKNVSAVLAVKQNLVGMKTNISVIEEGEGRFSLGFSVAMQDFEAYSKRDYGKPFRDARVGMLPPKLAQMMVNLAVGDDVIARPDVIAAHPVIPALSGDLDPHFHGDDKTVIYDPFCGTGTILMEAMLLGHCVIGSDADARMVEGARQNIDWLQKMFPSRVPGHMNVQLFQKNATELTAADVIASATKQSREPSQDRESSPPRLAVCSEPFLGPVLSTFPAQNFLEKVMAELKALYLSFFKNFATWLPASTPVVFIFPVWHSGTKPPARPAGMRLALIDKIEAFGYIKTTFVPLKETSLFYNRPGQVVGREIVRFVKK